MKTDFQKYEEVWSALIRPYHFSFLKAVSHKFHMALFPKFFLDYKFFIGISKELLGNASNIFSKRFPVSNYFCIFVFIRVNVSLYFKRTKMISETSYPNSCQVYWSKYQHFMKHIFFAVSASTVDEIFGPMSIVIVTLQ